MGRAEELFQAWLEGVGLAGEPEMDGTAVRFTEMFREFAPRPIEPLLAQFTLVRVTGTNPAPAVSVRSMPFYAFAPTIWCRSSGTPRGVPPERRSRRVRQHREGRSALRPAPDPPGVPRQSGRRRVVRTAEAERAGRSLEARQMCMEMRGARMHGEVEVLAVRGAVDAVLLDMARVD